MCKGSECDFYNSMIDGCDRPDNFKICGTVSPKKVVKEVVEEEKEEESDEE